MIDIGIGIDGGTTNIRIDPRAARGEGSSLRAGSRFYRRGFFGRRFRVNFWVSRIRRNIQRANLATPGQRCRDQNRRDDRRYPDPGATDG